MSIQAVAWALERKMTDPLAKLILISLANRADHVTGLCWPGMKLVAAEAGCARETVLRKLPALVDAGYIEIIKANKGDRKRAHTYRLLLAPCDGSSHQIQSKRPAWSSDLMCAPITRGCDTAITTEPSLRTITSTLPPSPTPRARQRSGLSDGRGLEFRSERPEVVQARIAQKLGHGDAAEGWMIFGSLSDAKRDELTAQERAGRLTMAAIGNLHLERMRQPP